MTTSMTTMMESLATGFRALEREHGEDRLQQMRRQAFARFRELGLPTSGDEAWRFTPLGPITKAEYALARPGQRRVTARDVARAGLGGPRSALLVFENGHFRADLSERGEFAASIAEAPPPGLFEEIDGSAFVALNAAFLEDGPRVRIPKGARPPHPLHILHLGYGARSFPRTVIEIEEGAEARIAEVHASLGEEGHFTNAVADVAVGRNASLEYARLQVENEAAVHVGALRLRQERDSRFTNHQITLGGALVRNDLTASLDGEHVLCTLNGLYLTRNTQHVDNHTTLLHRMPHGESHELYKGILDGRSSGVFTGKIHVFEGAQKTDAKQSSGNLLLTDTAVVDAQPQLEIYADDVKCTHGATVGQLDRNALFYLRSRGIAADAARGMLVAAFAADVTGRITIEAAREKVDALLRERLPGGA